ncbi:MAG TPA: hypothetical protein VGN13_05435 [Solirubrobacteraceae bacterium]|jgi:hypothetical protein
MASPQEQQQWISQAGLNALLRYAPQKAGLAELQKAAQDRFRESVQAGQSEGVLAQQAARQAVPATQAIFSSARQSGERGRDLVAPILSALSANSPFKAAAANESAAGAERLGQSESHALSDLQQRQVAAAELPAYTQSAANATLLKELQKLASKGSLLEASEGADKSAEVGKMRTEANRLAQQERSSERTAATSTANNQRSTSTSRTNSQETNATRREAAGGKGGVKPISATEQVKTGAYIAAARDLAKAGLEAGEGRGELVARLTKGRSAQSIGVNAAGQPIKEGEKAVQHHKLPAIPAYAPDARLSAALDEAEYGYVRPHFQHVLEQQGYSLKQLGLTPEPPNAQQLRQQQSEAQGIGKRRNG